VFQPYPGGTGAYLEKIARERGRDAFDREKFTVESWRGPVPTSEEEIAYLPAHRLAALIQSKRITSVQLTEIYLNRMKRLDPQLLCAVSILEGQAREAAQQADAEIRAGKYRGPLHGIPYGIKDLFAVRGTKTTWGSKAHENQVIDVDSEVSPTDVLGDGGTVIVPGQISEDVTFRVRFKDDGSAIVQRVQNRDARRERAEDCLDLPDVEVVRPEVGEKDDQAAFLAAGLSDSGASGRSISVTSASGALSPLRKPFFRIRR